MSEKTARDRVIEARDRFIETAKTNALKGDFTVLSYPNVKLYELLLIEVTIPKRFHKTEDLTAIAEGLAPLSGREVLEDAEASISTDNRLTIQVKLARKK